MNDYITLHKACDTNHTSRQYYMLYMHRYHNLLLKLQQAAFLAALVYIPQQIDCFIVLYTIYPSIRTYYGLSNLYFHIYFIILR